MNETLLQDLVLYRKSKDKGVVMASRGLLSLYRDVGADMLKRRDRGKEASMNLRAGDRKEKRFGEQEVGGIEGLDLLEKYKEEERRRKNVEKGLPSDAEDENEDEDENNWAAWNLDDDDDNDSDDSGGWINVQSDDDGDINLSDSDGDGDGDNQNGEKPPSKKAKQADGDDDDKNNKATTNGEATEDPTKKTNLATTRILTPADLAKLAELRTEAAVNAHLPTSKAQRAANPKAPIKPNNSNSNTTPARAADDPLTAAEIEGLAALSAGKLSREEKIAHAREGKTDRSEFRSSASKRQERKVLEGKSTTNKEKARRKNFMMTLGKARSKNKRSLVETRNVLKAHQDRQKRGGRRANGT